MIGTIRKHSAWLWWVVAGLTIISFLIFMGQGGTKYGGRSSGLGVIYGKPVTQDQYAAAQREFAIYYWRQSGQFPNKSPNFSPLDLMRETFVRILLTRKAKEMGIHVSEDAQATAANEFLSSFSRDHRPVPLSTFMEKILTPEGLTAADFQRFIVDDLSIQQLIQSVGMSGALITPQEAGQLYDRARQEYSAQAIFFSATNYVSQISATPAAVSMFYTNYMAYYRLPDRLQVNYVKYDLSNYLAAAAAKLGTTNLDTQVASIYMEYGTNAAPGARTPDEAKAKIRESLIRQAATKAAAEDALKLVTPLFAMEPPLAQNLVTLAQKDGLTVHTTAPFSESEWPNDINATPDALKELVKAMFQLNSESPFVQRPFIGEDGVYVIGLAKQLPSELQPLNEIRDRVAEDFKTYEAAAKARTAGSNFFYNAVVQLAAGKTFAQAAIASGQAPVAMKPFSLSSTYIPEAEGRAEVRELQQVAYSTQPGHVSPFVPTVDGGFILYVQSILPVDQAVKNANLPEFIAQMRRSRESEAFNLWLQTEANHELANIPALREAAMAEKGAAPRSP